MTAAVAPRFPSLHHASAGARAERPLGWVVPVATLLVAVIGARVHEMLPVVPRLRPALVLSAIALVLLVTRSHAAARRRVGREPIFRLTAAYVGWCAITIPFGVFIGGAVTAFQSVYPILLLAGIVILAQPTTRSVERLQGAIVVACAVTAVLAMAAGGGAERLGTTGTFDSNDLAAVMAMASPLALGRMLRTRGMAKLGWVLALGVLVTAFARTGSRGGTIAIVVASLVFVVAQPGSRRFLYAALCVGVAALTWTFGPEMFRERVRSMTSLEQDYNQLEYGGRKAIRQRAVQYYLENPVFGVGVGNFPIREGDTCRKLFPGMGCKWSAPHNAYVQAASELGTPGLAIYLALMVSALRRALQFWWPSERRRQGRPHRPELLASLLGFAVAAYFLSHAYFPLFFVLVALTALTSHIPLHTPAQGASEPARPGAAPASAPTPRQRGGLVRAAVLRPTLSAPRP